MIKIWSVTLSSHGVQIDGTGKTLEVEAGNYQQAARKAIALSRKNFNRKSNDWYYQYIFPVKIKLIATTSK